MRTEDDYRNSDLTPNRIREITVKLALLDRSAAVRILNSFRVGNIADLRFSQLRDYYEAIWAALEGGVAPTQEEWEEHARRYPILHRRVQDQIGQSRFAKVRGSAI